MDTQKKEGWSRGSEAFVAFSKSPALEELTQEQYIRLLVSGGILSLKRLTPENRQIALLRRLLFYCGFECEGLHHRPPKEVKPIESIK